MAQASSQQLISKINLENASTEDDILLSGLFQNLPLYYKSESFLTAKKLLLESPTYLQMIKSFLNENPLPSDIEDSLLIPGQCFFDIRMRGIYSQWYLAGRPKGLEASNKKTRCRRRILDREWIDEDLLNQWKEECNRQQMQQCHVPAWPKNLEDIPPTWLLDTSRLCLVSGDITKPYIALSYLWGTKPFFKTLRHNIVHLQKDNAFLDAKQKLGVPRTVSDAITVVRLLGERYLWVDSLCIVQDDVHSKHSQITNMASIYAHATITIIAQQGHDADFGLRGLRGTSLPRNYPQKTFTLSKGVTISSPRPNRVPSLWFKRGWTFQEEIFSRRKLIFGNDCVRWECKCCLFAEEVDTSLCESFHHLKDPYFRISTSLSDSVLPQFSGYTRFVKEYNNRDFTYPEDAHAAFAGVITLLSSTFPGGFLSCIPRLFFDFALCWQPHSRLERRTASNISTKTDASLPSWSWVGWKGDIDWDSRQSQSWPEYLENTYDVSFITRVFPLVEWYSWKVEADQQRVEHQYALETCKKEFLYWQPGKLPEVPPGWVRQIYEWPEDSYNPDYQKLYWPDKIRPAHTYRHKSDISYQKYWYPIPVCNGPQIASDRDSDPFLCCRTQRTWLTLGENIPSEHRIVVSVRDNQGNWVGSIQLHDTIQEDSLTTCELVAISRGYAAISGRISHWIDEWNHPERPRDPNDTEYEFYNVLWVEWEKGVAYRKALGRIAKDAWEAQDLEWVDLVLG